MLVSILFLALMALCLYLIWNPAPPPKPREFTEEDFERWGKEDGEDE
jgi:uncharacterized protein (UPF0128 family)